MWRNGRARILSSNELPPPEDEGGLRAPPDLHGWRKAWWWFHFLILVKLARLRFIAVLLVIGIIITQWDLLMAYYDRWTRPAQGAELAAGDHEFFCPMHPSVIRDNPKDKCPICFMPLSKRKKGDGTEEVLPAGVVNRVQLTPYRVALAGINTWSVEHVPLAKEITAVGYIEFNERAERNVSARVAGRLDKLFVNETGQMVREGDALASIYSPDLLVSVQNLLDAQRTNNRSLEQSTRRRLELLGMRDRELNDILSRGKADEHLVVRSPISGHVIKKYVREGEYVEEGSPLYDVVDLSTVWIQAQVYEEDLPFLPVDLAYSDRNDEGQVLEVAATTRAAPNEVFKGRLSFIYPHVDEQTRTVTVRFEVDNPDHKLRPGSTATVVLRVPVKSVAALVTAAADDPERQADLEQGKVLAVPESAVIDTGRQQIVYRETVPGVYEGVKVTLGPKMTGSDGVVLYPVLGGIHRGERVVTAGSFLVDAETRLNPAAGSIYFGGSSGSKGGSSSVTTVRPSTPEDEEAKVEAALSRLSSEDRQLAEAQQYCPVLSDSRLGSMGVPVKVMVEGQPVFLCCDGCKKQALAKPAKTLAKVAELKAKRSDNTKENAAATSAEMPSPPGLLSANEEAEIYAELAKLPAADRALAEAQRFCPISEGSRLGSMGTPVKVVLDGQPVFLCCEGCDQDALKNPKQTLQEVAKLKEQVKQGRENEPKASSQSATANEGTSAEEREIAEALAAMASEERKLAEQQRFCAVLTESRLGSMGTPIKLSIDGETVFICCKGCTKKALADKAKTLKSVERLVRENKSRPPRRVNTGS